jgi:hypothetical protein
MVDLLEVIHHLGIFCETDMRPSFIWHIAFFLSSYLLIAEKELPRKHSSQKLACKYKSSWQLIGIGH